MTLTGGNITGSGTLTGSSYDAQSGSVSAILGGTGIAQPDTAPRFLNDLWMYNPTSGMWTWEGGSTVGDDWGTFGNKLTADAANWPSGRTESQAVQDANGKVWLFGGVGKDSVGALGYLNDLWELDPKTMEWTWVSGSATTIAGSGLVGVYGQLGQESATNMPGSREGEVMWFDATGELWMMDGWCYFPGGPLYLNDVWKYNPGSNNWTWEGGSQSGNHSGVYGSLGAAAAGNLPGSRYNSISWKDGAGNVWLFGGEGYDAGNLAGPLNDLWMLDAKTGDWAWMSGPQTFGYTSDNESVFGTLGTYSATSHAGGRSNAMEWTAADGTAWIFGGYGFDSTVSKGEINDLWRMKAPKIPVIQWDAPAAISYGTALSATQLNATASYNDVTVPGSFLYTPAAGTVLSGGLRTLSVTFTPNDTTTYSPAHASVSITVNPVTPVVKWDAPAAIPYGTALTATQLNATASYNSASLPGTFEYTPAAGSVLEAGVQELNVTFTPSDTADYTQAQASVPITVTQATPVIQWATSVAINYGVRLSATQLNATAVYNNNPVSGSYAYSPSLGKLLTAGKHTLNVTFTPDDATDFTKASGSVEITVNQDTPVINWPRPAPITYGTALSAAQLNAKATYHGVSMSGTMQYSPAIGTVLSAGAHVLNVTFTPTDTTNFTTVETNVSLMVNPAVPTIQWVTPAAIAYGVRLSAAQLNATASFNGKPISGGFLYSPGVEKLLTAGTHTLSVTFTPVDAKDFTKATVTVQLVVKQDTPTISWAKPAAIVYGTALSVTQLNAKASYHGASLAGNFRYTPASGTVLAAGAQTLSVTFTPADTTDFTVVKASVPLTVNQATPKTSWAKPAAIPFGTPLGTRQLNASVSGYNGKALAGRLVYVPAAGTILTAGVHSMSLTFYPGDAVNYKTLRAANSIAVTRTAPAIQWATPAPVKVGTALSTQQLNAKAITYHGTALAGTYVYSPVAGTVMKTAGTLTLSVTFTPTIQTNYTVAKGTVKLTVTK